MGELVKLPGAVVSVDDRPEPSKAIIAYLEGKLEAAKRGELVAFAFVGVDYQLRGVNAFFIEDADARSELVAHTSYLGVQLALDAGAIEEETDYGEPGGSGG